MKKITYYLFFLVFASTLISGCKKEDDTNSCEFTEADAQAYSNVITKFSDNPTVGNCSALKQATLKLIAKYEKCDGTAKSEIEELTEFWVDLDCSEFD